MAFPLLLCPLLVTARILDYLAWADIGTLRRASRAVNDTVSVASPLVRACRDLICVLEDELNPGSPSDVVNTLFTREDACSLASGIIAAALRESDPENSQALPRGWTRLYLVEQYHSGEKSSSPMYTEAAENVYQSAVSIPLDDGHTLLLACFLRGGGHYRWQQYLMQVQVTAEISGGRLDTTVVWESPHEYPVPDDQRLLRFSSLGSLARQLALPRSTINRYLCMCFGGVDAWPDKWAVFDTAGQGFSLWPIWQTNEELQCQEVPLGSLRPRDAAQRFISNAWLLSADALAAFERLRQVTAGLPCRANDTWDCVRSHVSRWRAHGYLRNFPTFHRLLNEKYATQLSSEREPTFDATEWVAKHTVFTSFEPMELLEGTDDFYGEPFDLGFRFRNSLVHFSFCGDDSHGGRDEYEGMDGTLQLTHTDEDENVNVFECCADHESLPNPISAIPHWIHF
ncbi:hypothetical protein BDZ88DRAFT_265543 [Geranomyces variabilis]|nr:hypothetical protein BDZ88DRAFT_265543 [Geranomyces variabilis]KAJ3132488.1 hypothetical protein HDU90_006849 [Geranomyces variabilis]